MSATHKQHVRTNLYIVLYNQHTSYLIINQNVWTHRNLCIFQIYFEPRIQCEIFTNFLGKKLPICTQLSSMYVCIIHTYVCVEYTFTMDALLLSIYSGLFIQVYDNLQRPRQLKISETQQPFCLGLCKGNIAIRRKYGTFHVGFVRNAIFYFIMQKNFEYHYIIGS